MDIPESVVTASGAGALCGQLLDYRRGKLARERIYPPERDVSEEEPRVGVFVCHCGANIGRVVDVPSVVEYASTLDNVVHAEEGLFVCSTDTAQQISNTIREKGLNRVVVAACTPRTHEPLFRDTLREGGINQYFFDMANIREHCSWVHSKEKEEATQKAKDIVRMSVARTAHSGTPAGIRAAGQQNGPGGRRRPGRDDQCPEPWPTRDLRFTWWKRIQTWGGWREEFITPWKDWMFRPI